MIFDEIMRASGLDPDDPSTLWLMHFDDMDLRAFLCSDLVEAASEWVEETRKREGPDSNLNIPPRYMNLLAFVVKLHVRIHQPATRGIRVDAPASCLQKSTQGRVVQ